MAIEDELLQRLDADASLPSLPAVAARITELAQDPEIGFDRVASVVALDPALAAKVLRISNSALYAQRRRCSNLRQAIIVLGLNATLTLALSFSLVKTLRQDEPAGLDHLAFWRRALMAATWGKLLASETGRTDGEEIFLASLLQDIGMMAIQKALPEVYEGAGRPAAAHDELRALETARLGSDHAAIGVWLLEQWNIPRNITTSVGLSHKLDAWFDDPEYLGFVHCVGLSGPLADASMPDASAESLRRAADRARRLLGIEAAQLMPMFETVLAQLPEAASLFEIGQLGDDATDEILEKAQEVLAVRNLQVISEVSELRATAHNLQQENRELRERGRRDGLTGLHNRRAFQEELDKAFAAFGSEGLPLSVIFVDFDHFKKINDNHGHIVGDRVLRETAMVLRASTREADLVARYGGDEFVVLLSGTDQAGAVAVCERIVRMIGESSHRIDGKGVRVTTSLGVATCDAASTYDNVSELLNAADQALYEAKSGGRDRFAVYEGAVAPKSRSSGTAS